VKRHPAVREVVAVARDTPAEERLAGPEDHTLVQVEHHFEWNRTEIPLGSGLLVHERVARRAEEAPEALAVDSLTYGELVRRARNLACHLVRLGVEPESRVGVFAERSPEMVTGLLAVLNAGGAYLPIDPAYPPDRIAFVLDDARAPVLLTTSALAGRVPAYNGRVLLLDEELMEEIPGSGPLPEVDPGQLAYVIYTSGSTGRPKGVQIEHRSLLNLVEWHQREYGVGPADRATLVASPGFDASVWEIWPYLTAGSSLRVPPEAVRSEPAALAAWLAREGITISFLPTPLAEAVLEEPLTPLAQGSLRFLLTGGDTLHRGADDSAPFELVNHYGPTENTVVATATPVERGARRPPIGRPIANVRVYVLDPRLQPQPADVSGELFLGGASLARGYLDRPDLTAERFVPDPFSGALPGKQSGGRLYRTGDRVRHLPDGSLDFLGRMDFQVKVRGFRIELGEIEAALLEHPEVREAAVVARDEPLRLVAYVSADRRLGEEVRELLAARLPSYMVPSAFVVLRELPLGAHGKIDRSALPAPEETIVEPRTPLERQLAAMWENLLPGGPVGMQDGFFERGGHSLLATRLLARVARELGVSLPLGRFLQAPTVAELAVQVEAALGMAALAPAPRAARYPLSFPQQRLWFMDRLAPDSHTYNIDTAFRLRGPLDVAVLIGALSGVVDRHEVLRTRFVEVDGQPWQEVLPAGRFVVPVVDLSELPREIRERELARIGREEAARPFVLSRGPLIRASLVRMGRQEYALLLTLHHIASDGWSEAILERELSALYHGAPLPALPIQYADFAVWQRSWPAELLAGQVDWWSRRLAGATNLEVPTDRPRPPVQRFRGAIVGVALPADLSLALRDLARARRATPFIALLAAWQALFHRLTGQADVVVGSPAANRNRPEVEDLIGFFVNMLALRTDCGGDPSFAELLGRVRSTALEAYDHADVPFERVIDELGLERDLSRQALAQVMFSLHAPAPPPALRGVESERIQLAGAVAKFDLTLALSDRGESFDGWIEYSTDLFDRSTVARLAGQLLRLLEAAAERPDRRLSELELLSPAERHQLLGEWNDTAAPFPGEILMHQFFEAAVDREPAALAAVWNGKELTYAGLEERANRIANLLRQRGSGRDNWRGTPVGVWMERSLDMVAGVLAVLKAGGYYVPLDPAWPADRVESILRDMESPAILTRSCHLGRVLEMQWRLPALSAVVCLDVETPEPMPEAVDAEGMREMFDLLSERSTDRVTAGGFVSSTGMPFSEVEVDEYRDRVLALAAPWIGPEKRVLEIGVGSGLLMGEIAPRVARFVGLDPSPLTQERNRAHGIQAELPVGFAHEIEGWEEGSFDLVLIASTAQFFPGPLYLERVIRSAERLLAPGGAVVIADVPDARYPHKVLSLPEEFFLDLGATVHRRTTGFDNELRYRYDVVLQQSKERGKRLLTSWHVERSPAERLPAVAAPEDLAYVIHTSGSTGQPKGIVVQHRPVANLIHWIDLRSSDRVLFVTSLCFDLSVWDIFGVLAAGACVHVASEEDLQDAERLMRILLEEPVTIWDSAPAALVRLAPLFPVKPAVHSRLRRVMLSGDWIPVTLPDRVRAAFPHAEVMALGGATEATVWSNSYPVGEVDPEWPSIPYGRPMPNAQYRVLDAGLSPSPIGVPGDLYIGGDCLCVGYAHQPELTAAAFLPDPFGAPGSRIYRTGDRARCFADGNLEFLGRIDHQVKIRGFRIELGEIEAALARHSAVREAVVLAREDVPGDKRLVAYVVPTGELPDLRDFLRQTLPDYMIPAAFVELEALPVTPNGKLDRKALPAPQWEGAADEGAAPRTPTEQSLARLWREILGVEHVGVHDSFFDLGGHSLLATQLVAHIRQTFRVELPLRAVFQAPALGELAAAVDVTASAAEEVIHPIPREGDLPLSASQLRQWFLVQLEPGSVDYNLPFTVRLEGNLQRGALAAALRALVQRHESLRTVFVAVEGRPAAVILPEIHLPLPLLDLSSAPEEVLAAVSAETDRPFDLARGPLLRALLLRLGPREHLLALTLHHIVFDGFSAGVLLRELAALYRGADLPPLAVQYVDYAAWQREQLGGPAMRARIDGWKARLAGASQVLDLPTDRPRPAALSLHGEMTPVTLAAEGTAQIRRLAAREGTTLFMTLLAGYGALLSRYSGQDDLNVGTFVANRPRPELERLIGFFVNTLVLRVDLAGDPTFRELLARVREMALEAFENQEVPFESLLDELETGRDLARGPLFQAMFGLQNFAVPTVEVPGLAFEPVSLLDHTRTNGDLGFWMWEDGDELTGLLQRSTDLFDASTVLRMYRHLERLLAAAAANPESRLSELPLLSAGETAQILVEWNQPGEREPEPDALVHEVVEHWARVRPDAVALETADGREVLTWAELNRRGNQVGHLLRRLGVRTDQIVGIWAERCVEFVIGVLGVLKAGGAYMPLDPALPADRLAAILRGSGIAVLLARDGRPAELPPFEGEVVAVRGLDGPDADPEPRAVPESLAYVLFTSGSTGTPKGVLIPHSALANFAETTRRLYGIGPEDRVLQFSSLVFDISVEEIFTSWVAGAALILRNEEMVSSPARFLRAIGELEIQMVDLPTAYWHELGVELARGLRGEVLPLPACVRSVVFAGERALQERLAGWRDAMDHGVRLFNSYGPSETTPACSVFDPAEPAAGCSTNGLPIGKPMRGARLYATDPDLRPVPMGVAGELLIAGQGVGRGYAGRPDLTAERFVPDPFSAAPGERVYRTGDRVRWLRDGNLEFLGRVDDQVKVRGFRVEPGEIAAVICRHPGVREAVVVPRESASGLRLVAYAAAEPGTPVTELRELVKSALPAYMVPADFVLLDALPLTATGKLDRRALPEPTAGDTAAGDGYAPPETVTEELLAAIWAGLLGRERVGIFDDFFDLGGHSLLAPQVFARIEETFQVELPLRALFEAPTVAQLANRIEQELLAGIEGMSEEEAEKEAESLVEMERR
jgi:amino acid adenylation domain-containing protein